MRARELAELRGSEKAGLSAAVRLAEVLSLFSVHSQDLRPGTSRPGLRVSLRVSWMPRVL